MKKYTFQFESFDCDGCVMGLGPNLKKCSFYDYEINNDPISNIIVFSNSPQKDVLQKVDSVIDDAKCIGKLIDTKIEEVIIKIEDLSENDKRKYNLKYNNTNFLNKRK